MIEAVRNSIEDAISDDPKSDWKDSLGDALDTLELISIERTNLLEALQGMVDAMDKDLFELKIAELVAKVAIANAEGAPGPECSQCGGESSHCHAAVAPDGVTICVETGAVIEGGK
tara:strand:+ start:1771 stop:2118 length:348 start_codon:yes stop_codon:yes gene_type:complete